MKKNYGKKSVKYKNRVLFYAINSILIHFAYALEKWKGLEE